MEKQISGALGWWAEPNPSTFLYGEHHRSRACSDWAPPFGSAVSTVCKSMPTERKIWLSVMQPLREILILFKWKTSREAVWKERRAHVHLLIHAGCRAEHHDSSQFVWCWWRRVTIHPADKNEWKWENHSAKELGVCVCVCGHFCMCVWVLLQLGSLSLQLHNHTQQAGMREREELRRAKEQSDRLLSKVRELEEQNVQLNKEQNEVATRYRAVSLLLCSAFCFSFLL